MDNVNAKFALKRSASGKEVKPELKWNILPPDIFRDCKKSLIILLKKDNPITDDHCNNILSLSICSHLNGLIDYPHCKFADLQKLKLMDENYCIQSTYW
jgi:hypothetical protein